ncbi:helicase [Patescibacteria group bacterium]|nr:helicase [Patescibacteria group bacterium]
MGTSTDLTFITNEGEKNLLQRFKILIKDTQFFDVLVGYFFTSGFYKVYKTLDKTKKIRILIGIKTDQQVLDNINQSDIQTALDFSHSEVKEKFSDNTVSELNQAEDTQNTEEGVTKFIDWLKSNKLEIKAYPTSKIHTKLYIMTFAQDDRDKGRVITGSSNFSQSGLIDNLEFNVELKNRSDYDFALKKFNQLWADAVDVSQEYIDTIQQKTWLNNTISPYQLYLKFLYEYFKDQLSQSDEVLYSLTPTKFKKLAYQEQAVLNAKKILLEYGGVFISDVVGLGKTYIAAMLANQLDGRNLVIAPPILLDKNNPGSWPNVFTDFGVKGYEFESVGKLDRLIKQGTDKFTNIYIDEAHRFRTEDNATYEKLAQVCQGKRVILVTATPYNNSPKDILSQIKLFQAGKKSTIPNLPNLEQFFTSLIKKLKGLDRQHDQDEYLKIVKENAKEIREKVLKYLMVRRTRKEIIDYFGQDLKDQGLKFPEVADPQALFYELNQNENKVFDKTIELITQQFSYARYSPLIHYAGELSKSEIQGQVNMGRFMKILLIKRLESSFYAFRKTLNRFIYSYEQFLNEYNKGNVYISKKHSTKVFELLENDNDEAIQKMIDEDKAKRYSANDFRPEFKKLLENDLKILNQISQAWQTIDRDPKLLTFIKSLSTKKIFEKNKLIIFTESRETAEYLHKNLSKKFPKQVIAFHGTSSSTIREQVIENFDAQAQFPKSNFRILISTEVLSEGVNLHKANVVINYDIPWNPTRLMQRVGRINRVDTPHDKIYSYNFFPTQQSNDQIKLKEAAQAKIEAFIELLGNDARLLTDGEEIKSVELFSKLTSKKTITGEDETEESELKYLKTIRELRDNNPDLFEKIKLLPRKARTAKAYPLEKNSLLTYFRKGKLQKFYLIKTRKESEELDFISAAKILESDPKTKRLSIGEDFYSLLSNNKQAFTLATTEEAQELQPSRGRDSSIQLLTILKTNQIQLFKGYTEDQEKYLKTIMKLLKESSLPKNTSKRTLKEVKKYLVSPFNPLKIIAVLQKNIPSDFLKSGPVISSAQTAGPREVILSEYLN